MSTTIDQRIVEMRFDNKQFESGVETSLSSIGKLKQGLDLSGASKGLENVSLAAKDVSGNLTGISGATKSLDTISTASRNTTTNLTGITGAIDTIRLRFSAMEVIAVTTLANITNSAVNAGKRIVSALTIDPIKTGFQEYETQINAIQTILANTSSKGTTLDDVNKALGELNKYADMTIYNFTQMTRNIGTFTAAGVDLDTSVAAIKGIANLAAVSGSTSQQASTAMYQLSQALASGTVKLMDWNSVVNAGMGGQVFQDALKETARVHGIAIDAMIKDEGSFRETLSLGWLSSEILTETLSKFTGDLNAEQLKTMGYSQKQIEEILKLGTMANDAATKVKTLTQLWETLRESAQSGWTQTWEILVGDFEEAKVLFTEISNSVGDLLSASAEVRNSMLEEWKGLGGRTKAIEAFRNAIAGIVGVVKPVGEAWKEVFPSTTGKQLYAITEAITKFSERMKLSDTASKNLKDTFKGLFSVLDIFRSVAWEVVKALFPLTENLGGFGEVVLEVTGSIGRWLTGINEFIKKNKVFEKTIQNGTQIIKDFVKEIKDFVSSVGEKLNFNGFELLHNLLERIQKRMVDLNVEAGNVSVGIITAFQMMGESISTSKFVKGLEAIFKLTKELAGFALNALGDAIGYVADAIGNANFNNLFDALNTISLGAVAIGIKNFLKTTSETVESFKDLSGILDGVKGILDGVRGSFEAYQTQLKAGTLMKIASAIGVLTAAILVLSLIDSEKLSESLGAVTVLFTDLMAAMFVFSKFPGSITGAAKTTTMMIGLSTSILILSGALKSLSEVDSEKMSASVIGISSLMVAMVAMAKWLGSGSPTVIKGASQMVIFALAIKVLASACTDLADLEWDGIGKGLLGVGALLAGIVLFMKYAKFSENSISSAIGIVIIAGAIKILASACEDFSKLSFGQVIQGFLAIGGLLALLTAFTNLTSGAKGMISIGVGMIAVGAAMKILASAVKDISDIPFESLLVGLGGMSVALLVIAKAVKAMPQNTIAIGVGLIAVSSALFIMAKALESMGGMTWEQMAIGLGSLGASLFILSKALNSMNTTLAGSASLLVAALALGVLTPVLSVLGAMPLESIGKAILALAGTLAVIGIAAALLTPVVPTMLAFAGSIALIGLGIAGVGIGLLAIGAGLSAVAVGFTALGVAAAAGTTAVVAAITAILAGVVGMIPTLVIKLGEGIIELFKMIGEAVPVVAETFLKLITESLKALAKHAPEIVGGIFEFLLSVLESITKYLPALIKAGVDVIMSFFAGVTEALKGIDVDVLLKGIVGIGLLSGIMLALAATSTLIPGALVGVAGMAAVIAALALVLTGVGLLAQIPGLSWLIGEGGKLLQGIGTAIGSFIGGIVGGFMGGVSSQFPKIAEDLAAFMKNIQPFVEGSKNIDASSMSGIKALAEAILVLTAANVLNGLASWFTGGSSLTQFGKDLASFGPHFKKYYDSISGIDGTVVEKSANVAKSLAEMAKNLPNQGGMLSWFTGDNTLSIFGKELAAFGPNLKKYADSVRGMDATVVTNSTNAAKALAELANNLPNSGGLISWFTGDNDIASFGKKLVSFGQSFAAYYESIKGINTYMLSSAVTEFKNLVEVLKGIQDLDSTAMEMFPKNLKAIGNAGVNGFIESFTFAIPKVITAGQTMMSKFVEGLNVKESGIRTAFTTALTKALLEITNYYSRFYEVGVNVATQVANGIEDNISKVEAKARALARAASEAASLANDILSMDVNPVITPVLDLSNVEAGVQKLNTSLTQTKAVNVSSDINSVKAAATSTISSGSPAAETKISFTQNNYSPKALSRIEIYRQTQNQFSAVKGLVSAK